MASKLETKGRKAMPWCLIRNKRVLNERMRLRCLGLTEMRMIRIKEKRCDGKAGNGYLPNELGLEWRVEHEVRGILVFNGTSWKALPQADHHSCS